MHQNHMMMEWLKRLPLLVHACCHMFSESASSGNSTAPPHSKISYGAKLCLKIFDKVHIVAVSLTTDTYYMAAFALQRQAKMMHIFL